MPRPSTSGTIGGAAPRRAKFVFSRSICLVLAVVVVFSTSAYVRLLLRFSGEAPAGGEDAKGTPEENANERILGGGAGPSGRGGGGEGPIQAAAAEGGGSESSSVSYALLYPNSDCSGENFIRINSTESERKCSNCRDLCNLRFPGDDKTANDRPAGSISIRFKKNGKHRLELHSRCVGTYDDEGKIVLMTHKASDEECLAAETPFDHVKFVPASAH